MSDLTTASDRDAASRSPRPARDATIDVLRGFAVITMVAANLAGPVLVEPHPFWLRLWGSIAAPLFVVLAGMTVAYTAGQRSYGLKHFLARSAVILAIAAAIDLFVWRLFPFVSMDVLYLIGVSLPLAWLALQTGNWLRWVLIAGIVVGTPVLQSVVGYAEYPTELHYWDAHQHVPNHAEHILNHWFVDGWFPVFPWLAFVLLGVEFGAWRQASAGEPRRLRRTLSAGAIIAAAGTALWAIWPGEMLTRGGYSELFYPPVPGFVVTSAGVCLLLCGVVDLRPDAGIFAAARWLGCAALSAYVAHIILIRFVIKPRWGDVSLGPFAALYAGLMLTLLALAWCVPRVRRQLRRQRAA